MEENQELESFDCNDSQPMVIDEEDQLPPLGLSYRRGQRETQTGQMTRFLAQLSGDPWGLLSSEENMGSKSGLQQT